MGERYDPNTKNQSGADRAHIVRYLAARGFISLDDVVIDAACGTGYGTNILSQVAEFVYGYDYNEQAINTAKSKYNSDDVLFQQADLLTKIDYPHADVVVSLETLEHLKDPSVFLKAVYSPLLKFLITSVPTNERPEDNPFHVQYFTKGTFDQLLMSLNYQPYHSFMQGTHYISIWTPSVISENK